MKLAIMQPYFFPYIGYFSIMDYADEFILFDTVQFDRKSWMKRNRILKSGNGWQYIQAGIIKPNYQAKIYEVLIDKETTWKEKIMGQMVHYKNIAPYYEDTIEIVNTSLSQSPKTLTQCNLHILCTINNYLDIDCPISLFSEMDMDFERIEHAGQWALKIASCYGANEYVNPPGGKEIFNKKEFRDYGIKLSFLKHKLSSYRIDKRIFEPGLSIIDVMMFNGKNGTKEYLREYEIESQNFCIHSLGMPLDEQKSLI